jgi:hypothetical protein
MSNKIYKKLPVVLQTTAIKNFFESTVEQLFSKANVEVVSGYIGSKSSADVGITGYIAEPNNDKARYALSPVVNTINYTTKESEDFIFFDELIDILSTYGVDTSNQNKIFGANFNSFVPPIELDKFVNYQEYYWFPDGPTVIPVVGTLDNPIDIDRDILGKQYYTPVGGKPFRNGMVVRFTGQYVIPSSELEIDYIVQGVGQAIYIVPRRNQFQTVFSTPVDAPYDGSYFPLNHPDIAHQAGNVSSVTVVSQGIGYVSPTVSITGSNVNVAVATANVAANGAITGIAVSNAGRGYTRFVSVELADINIAYDIDTANIFTGSSNVIVTADIFLTEDPANVRIGQSVNGIASGIVSKKFDGAEVEGYFGTYLTVPTANVNPTTGTFTYPNHGLATDDEVVYDAGGSTPISNILIGGRYQVLVVDSNRFQLKELGNIVTSSPGDTGNNSQGFIKKSTTFTVTAVNDGSLAAGMMLHHNDLVYKTKIVSQLSGTTGSTGTYRVDVENNTVHTFPETFTVKPTVVLSQAVELELNSVIAASELTFAGRDFLAEVNYEWEGTPALGNLTISGTTLSVVDLDGGGTVKVGMVLSASGILPHTIIVAGSGSTWTVNKSQTLTTTQFTGYPAGSRLGINPANGEYYLMGGQWSFDRNDLDDDEFDGDSQWDAGLTVSPPEYLTVQRGAENKNIWSTINFWYHQDNFKDAGMPLPNRRFRAERPIIEFDRRLELYNHGKRGIGSVIVACTQYTIDEVIGMPTGTLIDSTPIERQTIIFPNEQPDIAKYVYVAYTDLSTETITVVRAPHPELNPIGAVDGDFNFVPWELNVDDVVLVRSGAENIGTEYRFTLAGLVLCQRKLGANQAPLFNLYDTTGVYLGDEGTYPNNNFEGNKIFSYALGTGVEDPVLKFPLSWIGFKASSEIEFSVDMAEANYLHNYQPFGGNQISTTGYKFYKLELNGEHELLSMMVPSDQPARQRLVSTYTIDRFDVDNARREFWIGCVPDLRSDSSYDVDVFVNGIKRTDWQYGVFSDGYIVFDRFDLSNGDFIEISAFSSAGQLLVSDKAISKFELPLSWKTNVTNEEITATSSPEFTQHFKNYMERQVGFEGDALQVNNFSSTLKDIAYATDIVVTDQDVILGALLLDDQPHNLVDAIRFNAEEYMKYKARLKKEISAYYTLFDTNGLSNEFILEKVLQNIISFSVGREVFNRTYVIPYGDNYLEERFEINDVNTTEFVSSNFTDLNKIENSLLVYHVNADTFETTLLNVDKDYIITNFNPISIVLNGVNVDLDDEIVLKLYNEERDSAQCPPTPSILGIYPLFEPRIEIDNSFQTPVQVLVGHDGSKTTLFGDRRDEILLEFEKRVFNSAKAEFRSANALPELNIYTLKPGAFRETGYTTTEWASLKRYYFSNWSVINKIDYVTNEFYSDSNEWTWNYRGNTDLPGHWRGWYEHYYDTVRPHTHPWEMLAFFEKPLWWDSQYGTDYSSANTAMWDDIEEGIIRSGARENLTDDAYLINNPYRREGLHLVLPVDANSELKTPKDIITTGTTTKTSVWSNSRASGLDYRLDSFVTVDGLNVSSDNSNIYISGRNKTNHIVDVETNAVGFGPIEEQDVSYNLPKVNLNLVSSSPTEMPDYAVAVLANGVSLYNPKSIKSWDDRGVWHYNNGTIDDYNELATFSHSTVGGLFHYHAITPDVVGLTAGVVEEDGALKWDSTTHSPIVGWAFDGLPIYGPYGYTDPEDITSDIVNIRSPWALRQGTRSVAPGGAYTGMFVEDYEIDATKSGQPGYTNQFNLRYGFTPDSPATKIRYYVVTVDNAGKPMFPYAIGGGYATHTSSTKTWAGQYYAAGQNLSNNTLSSGNVIAATPALTSTLQITFGTTDARNDSWKFGDGAPAENAWKYSEAFPFAVTEALLLARPGKFATEFANPTKLYRPAANKKYKLSVNTNYPWIFTSATDFEIHGDKDDNGNFITNIGYTQFINSWLRFQGLSPESDFITKVRSLNTKLGHRMSGFIDKDTMTLRTDQYSNEGSATSLIIPHENITVNIHSSPYKSRNFYSGVIIEKTSEGHKVRGYDKNLGYFTTLQSDKNKGRERISVGGTPAQFVDYSQNTTYKEGTIVRYKGAYYAARETFKTGTTFETAKWRRFGALPQIGAATGTLYQQTTGNIIKVDYETVFDNTEDLFDFLISLGRYQEAQGYTFGNFDETISEVRDWAYAAKQFLFWTTGVWEIGNTLELSPMANKITFVAPRGFIAKINRTDRSQFNVVNQNGVAINPTDCEIVRQDNTIEIVPPEGEQIYGVVLFTKEIEHAFVVDNVTQFNDVIFNPAINQGHSRLKIKATRTAGWDGRFLSQGFVIEGDSLKPNLDNMAESLGRYHELGFIPVEKQLYEASRAVFGFEQKQYLTELDIIDDQQYDFYAGMLQSKGTTASLERIGTIVPALSRSPSSEINVYDEWALRVADFGDTNQDQAIELQFNKIDQVQDPQLFTLAFPEDTTNIVEKIEVLERKHKYFNVPQIVISAPVQSNGVRATATATLNSAGELGAITVTNPGSGYGEIVGVTVIAGEIVVDLDETVFDTVRAYSTEYVSTTSASLTGNLTITDFSGASNVTTTVNLSTGISNISGLVNAVNNANTGVTAIAIRSDVNIGGTVQPKYTLELRGNGFTINSADANLHLNSAVNVYQNGVNYTTTVGSGYRYEPRQRYGFEVANNTVKADVTVSVNNSVLGDASWDYDAGDRWQITTAAVADQNNPLTVLLNSGLVNGNTTIANENYTTISNNNYPFVDVYVNGVLIQNSPEEIVYTLTASTVEFANISLLPTSVLTSLPNPATKTSRFVLASQSNVFVVEKGTIDFTNAYKGDVTGSILNIKVETHDHIAIKLGTRRNYEITPDATDDDIILIDIDDSSRFLRKPTGSRENNLWPTLTNVNSYGLTTEKYPTIPNAGYVNPANVNFMAYDIASLPDLFDNTVIIKPAGGSLIHMAEDESKNWNVYKLQSIGSRTSFVENKPGSNEAVLYTDRSLFAYLDTNLIGNDNTSKYMDYYLTLKNANVSDSVVIWTNETIVQQKKTLIKDPQPPKMIEARIKSIGPHPESLITIQNILPVSSKVYRGATASASSPSNVVTISGITNSDIRNGDAVQLVAGESTDYTFNANVTFNSVGNVTIDSANITFVTAPSFVTLLCDGDSTANGNIYYVKSKNVSANTFVIESDYFEDANVVSGLGNVRYVTSTFVSYGNISNHYIASNATTNAFTIELAGVIEKTATFNGSITGTVLTVNTVAGGVLERGMSLSGAGIAADTVITSGSDLSWLVSNSQTVGNVTITATRPNVIDIRHMNLTKLVTSSAHNLNPGDVVKVYANAWTGAYSIVSTPEANTVIISSPYTTDDKITGTIVRRGMQIKTTDPHGITKSSVDLNKRVAVHFATPKVYNKVYRITSVGSDTINVLDDFAVSDTTSVYFDVASGFANNTSNTFTIARRPILAATTVLYASNTQPVMAGDYYIDENLSNTTITFKNTILSEDANVSTGFVIIREPISTDFRYPVLTTVDHTKVTLNNSVINIGSYNNQAGMIESINRAIRLRRSAVTQDRSGKLNVSFNMLNDFKTPVRIPDTDIKSTANKIHNYGPYVRDEQSLTDLVGDSSPVKVAGEMKISDAVEYQRDAQFDTGPVYVGPLKGMRYTDSNGVLYYWDLRLRKYIPNYETVSGTVAPGLAFALQQDTSISDGSEASSNIATDLGNSEDLDNAVKKPSTPRGHSDGAKVLIIIPGTAESNPIDPSTKAVKWSEYNMSETVVYDTVTYPRWRLNTSEIWQFEVYEAVQNTSGTVYYVLVDVVPADLPFAYDYFATVSAYNNFNGSITETVYYTIGGTEQTADTSIAWDDTRNDKSVNFKYIEISPVEPAFFVGKQIIPEPFADKGGNGTQKLANFGFMPKDVIIGSPSSEEETIILVTTPGHNSFFMWQPGIAPGKWEPAAEGPGLLPGAGGAEVAWGFGRGYYSSGDNHVPDSLIFGDGATFNSIEDTNPYPGYSEKGWSTRQARFKYGKEFSVYPVQSPESGFAYFDDNNDIPEDQTNTKIRADEVFVACFWTEPHTYVNQMIGFDYNNTDNDGNPTPVYKDYNGTIARVKYIRLTELPADAVLRRPIADTGWGGKRWRNVITDEVLLPGETLPEGYAGPEGYGAFAPDQTLTGGSTGDEDELPRGGEPRTGGAPRAATQRIGQIGLGAGFGRGTPTPYSAVTLVDERNLTPPAPVLTGGVLADLPSKCDLRAPNPVPPRNEIMGACTVRPTVPKTSLLTEKTNAVGVDETHVINIQGKHPFLLIFDFSYDDGAGTKSVNGITIEQSDTPDFKSVKRYIIDTQTDPSTLAETNGSQIGRYGFDTIPGLNTIIYKPAENALGVLTQRVIENPLDKFNTTAQGRIIAATAKHATTNKVLGVSGFGFLNRTIDCTQGQYVRITVSKGSANKTGKYALFVRYFADAPNEVDVALSEINVDNCMESPSRAYKEGGIITGYTFTKSQSNGIFTSLAGAGVGATLGVGIGALAATTIFAASAGGLAGAAAGLIGATGGFGVVVVGLAIIGGLVGSLFKKKKGEGAGYFGSWKKKTSTFGSNEDNIYFPYSRPTQGMITAGVDREAFVGGGAKQVQQVRLGILEGGKVTEYSTTEFKGYFFAPKSGTYNFEMESDDGSWLWVSPKDDLSGDEYYKSDGAHPELGNKNYTWQNAIVKNGGLHVNRKATGSIYLKGGGLYFVRGIYGNGEKDGNFSVNIKGPDYSGALQFASRSCPQDDCGKFQAGEMTNLDPVMRDVMRQLCADTTTFNPASTPAGVAPGGGSIAGYGDFNVNGELYTGGGNREFAGWTNYAVNFSGYSQQGLTGYNFMPASFKTPIRKQVVDPQKYGYSESLDSGRYVNATSQRVTGGFTIPLAKKLTVVSRTSTPLRSYEIVDQPWYRPNTKTLGNLNQTLRNINYAPKRVGTSVTLNGVPVNNITTDANSVDADNGVTITTLNEIPATFATNTNEAVVDLGTTAMVPVEDGLLDIDNITYTRVPTLNITPLTYGPNGELVPVGPTAVTNIYRPTPEVLIDGRDLATVPAGTELFFNDARVLFVAGTTPRDIATQIKCNQSGVDAQVQRNPDGVESLVVRSCSDNAIAIKNGCGGGTLKRVGDFHVVRGFEQTTTTTNTESCSSNATVLSATTGYMESNTSGVAPTAVYTLYDCGGNITGVFDNGEDEITPFTGAVLPSKTTSTTISSTYQNGGSGYQIGDRLRLIGGTPTNNTRGPIGSICVNVAGAGYNNPANLRISFGGDSSPGTGAAAEVTSIDETNGSITGVRMLNYGIGYDVKNPPSVTVTDISPRGPGAYLTVDAADLQGLTYSYNTIIEVQNHSDIDDSIIASGSTFYRVVANSIVLGAVTTVNAANISNYAFTDVLNGTDALTIEVSNASLISGKIVEGGVITLLVTGDGTAAGNTVQNYLNNVAFTVSGVSNSSITINDSYFTANVVSNISVLEFSLREPIESAVATGALRKIADQRMPLVPAELSARVGVVDITSSIADTTDSNEGDSFAFIKGYKSLAGPLRVAKFIVTGVDDNGAITSLRVIDRGLYTVFPSDLTQGIPLEYDYDLIGLPAWANSNNLGIVDPSDSNNTAYGQNHPEYGGPGNTSVLPFINGKHPNIIKKSDGTRQSIQYPEFKYDTMLGTWTSYTGSPGAYDPQTSVDIGGQRLAKQYAIVIDPLDPEFGNYATPLRVAGGTGARVFLTSDDVPDCSEKGRAKEDLGLPDQVVEIDVPKTLADALNNALTGAGYLPEDITFRPVPAGPGVGKLNLVTNYPSVNIDTNTPGFPEKLGIEIGDYNVGMLCIEAEFVEPNLSDSQLAKEYENLYESGPFGLLSQEDIAKYTTTAALAAQAAPPTILSLLCVDSIKTDGPIIPDPEKYVSTFDRFNPELQNTGFGADEGITYVSEYYKYDIRNIFGNTVTLEGQNNQNVNVFVFESQRYNNVLDYNENKIYLSDLEQDGDELANVWIDQYVNLDPANISMPEFIPGGWAYLENGTPQRWQTPMVDTNYVKNALMYDPDTGNKTVQFDLWDPFKGVLPGFIQNEIHYIAESDPVNYNNARTRFGVNNIGKVWWDTSTIKYMWYEQGSNRERWVNWGRTFPGSAVTICEWVESKALPQNWNGNGTPRWPDKYIAERRIDADTGKYVTYYYYWVQNRTIVDSRVTRNLGRQFDTETLARYIANPVGYGLTMASFISNESFVLHNVSQHMKEENVIQINVSRNTTSDGIKHTAWKLVRENDNNSIIPEHISEKLIDSLCGENAIGQQVPDPTLSEVEKYGISFRPRQTLFKDVKAARRTFRSVVNELLRDLKLETQYSSWDAILPDTLTYLERVNWYEVERVDTYRNTKIRYDNSYKPVFNVGSVGELYTLKNLPDGAVIQVKSATSDRPQLWMYIASENNFKLISIKNETLQIKPTIITAGRPGTVAYELRILLNILRSPIFNDIGLWNKVFFEMLKYAYTEQPQLSWAFKTSYLYIEKDEEDLIPTVGFRPDNFARIIEYMNEVKPFNAKIREYRDGKRPPIETIGATMVSDFDKPPYIDRELGVVRVLDDFSQNDANIMFVDNAYSNYFSITNKGDSVFRHNNTTLVFDRTNYQLTQFGHNASTTPINLSIARNIANLNQMTEAQITANVQMRAIDRIFKFDSEVRFAFAAEVSTHYNDITAGSNTSITTNATVLYDIINSGNLAVTLNLVKEKVGGGWRGETIDANVFSKVVYGLDPTTTFLTNFGWDTDAWDVYGFDRNVEVTNYEGIFSELTQGNITLRRNNETYEGFDGATFKKVLYGEERPEEMVMLDPLESLIIDVYTSPYASGNTSTTPVAPNAVAVEYRMHQNLFGDTEFIRISSNKTATVTSNVYTYSTEITVDDASVFQTPRPGDPGVIWVGTERVLYERKDGNIFSQLTRGSAGTSVQDHLIKDIYDNDVTITVVEGSEEETFNRLDTNRAVWLEVGSEFYTYETYNVSTVAYANVAYAETGNANSFARANMAVSSANATVGANQLTLTTTANAIALLNQGGTVAITANGNLLTAEGTSYTVSYASNVTFFYIKDIDGANNTITVEDDIFMQDGMWDYYAFDSGAFDEDITEVLNGNVTVTLEIPTLNTGANTALSLADVANADYANTESLMKFIHGI